MILDREVYFPNPFHKRLILFIKKFFFILTRFLGRPSWGRASNEASEQSQSPELMILIKEEGKIKALPFEKDYRVSPTSSIVIVSPSQGTDKAASENAHIALMRDIHKADGIKLEDLNKE